jgi:1,4-alpha-glucan branching enzyme
MPGDDWQKFANARLFLGYMFAHPGKKLLFMGSDFGQRREWTCDESLDWHFLEYEPHRQLNLFIKDLNRIYKNHKAFYEVDFDYHGFEWVDFSDAAASVVSFIRWSKNHEELLFFTFNMTPVPRLGWRFGAPRAGFYEEILNSDAREYGGGGIGNSGGVHSEPTPWQRRPQSVCVNLPPLAVNVYRWRAS